MYHLFHRAEPGATTTGEGIAAPENVKPVATPAFPMLVF